MTCCSRCGAVQKLRDGAWLEDIRRIYGDYDIFHMSAGAEQLIFGAGTGEPRSKLLAKRLTEQRALPERGRLLDIGCGNGAALATFSEVLPKWELCGSELAAGALPQLRRIPNFDRLYTEPSSQIAERFTVVTMIHSLEHMLDPLQALADALRLLDPGGTLLVEVPDVETSPFDLLVADHLMHFSTSTLSELAARAGISAFTVTNEFLPKEITLISGGPTRAPAKRSGVEAGRIVRATVAWLQSVLDAATASAKNVPFGIFGTAIAGMALYGALRERVAFFVDEDPSRVGRSYDGKPILLPQDVPSDATVFIALAPEAATRVGQRLSQLPPRFIAPAPQP